MLGLFTLQQALLAGIRKIIIGSVQIARDISDFLITPGQADAGLPAAHLSFEAIPVGRQLLLPPVNFRGVACDAMCRIKQFTPRFAELFLGKHKGIGDT